MPRITVSIPDDLHEALRNAAASQSLTISEIVTDALAAYGLESGDEALEIVRSARERTRLSESEALEIAERESRSSGQ